MRKYIGENQKRALVLTLEEIKNAFHDKEEEGRSTDEDDPNYDSEESYFGQKGGSSRKTPQADINEKNNCKKYQRVTWLKIFSSAEGHGHTKCNAHWLMVCFRVG